MGAVINSKQLYFVMAALVLAVVVTPVAIAGAAGGAKPAPVAKAVKQLKKQVAALQQQAGAFQQQAGALQQQIASLREQGDTPRAPIGPAGGDLTGTFPNPLIGPNTVGAEEIQTNAVEGGEIADDSVSALDIKPGAVETSEIANSAVLGSDIADFEVTSADLDSDSVGGEELKPVIAVVGPGVTVSAGTPAVTSVTCPAGRRLIAGGFAWTDKEKSTILASAPSEGSPTTTWTVEGMVDSGSNGLFAWASCLAF